MFYKRVISMALSLIIFSSFFVSVSAKSTISVTTPTIKSITENLDNIVLKWKKDTTVSGYKIYRSSDKLNWSVISDITDNITTKYVDKAVINDVVYYYAIK